MSIRKKLVAGNWKMNGDIASSKALAVEVANGLDGISKTDVILCPSAIHITEVVNAIGGNGIIKVGSQDVSVNDNGAYTGETSCSMLNDAGCAYAIVGHSERRQYHNETSQLVAQKAQKALQNGLIPIICVGESLEQRQSNETQAVIEEQVQAAIGLLGIQAFEQCVIAYEPVWAIGTGMTATPEQAQEIHAFIRSLLAQQDQEISTKTQILYGGSVKPDNAKTLFGQADIDGGLIGGAALKASDFLAIIQAADQL